MKKFLKIFVLVAIVSLLILSLASCGNGAANPDSVSGDWEGISWSYDKDSHVLTLTGGGEIPDANSPADVPWNTVRGAVTGLRIKTGDGKTFTKIGNYAFYGMSKLASVEVPSGVESVGKCAFAFCTVLDEITLPNTVTKIGESAFEGCSKLADVSVPASVTDLGARAFAFCRELTTVTVEGKPAKLGEWCFKDCAKLENFRMDTTGVEFDATAFEGAIINKEGIKSLHTSVVNIICKDESGATIKTLSGAEVLEVDEEKEISAPAVNEYEVVGEAKKTAKGTGEPIDIEFTYNKTEEKTTEKAPSETVETPVQTPEKDKNPIGAIIAIVIFVVVIAAIAVGSFLLIRSDKKTTKDSMTVRKNANEKGKKK